MYRPFDDRTARQPNARRTQETTQAPRFERVNPAVTLEKIRAEMYELQSRIRKMERELHRVEALIAADSHAIGLPTDEQPYPIDQELTPDDMDLWLDRGQSPSASAYRGKILDRLSRLEADRRDLSARKDTPEPPIWELRS